MNYLFVPLHSESRKHAHTDMQWGIVQPGKGKKKICVKVNCTRWALLMESRSVLLMRGA